jgi:hypothetical protein
LGQSHPAKDKVERQTLIKEDYRRFSVTGQAKSGDAAEIGRIRAALISIF